MTFQSLPLDELIAALRADANYSAALSATVSGNGVNWLGLTDTLKAATLLGLAAAGKRPVLAVVEGGAAAETLTRRLKELLGAEENRAQEFPPLDVFPLAGLPPHPGILSRRGRFLSDLITGQLSVGVISAPALALPVPGEKLIRAGIIPLRAGAEGISRPELVTKLWELGYLRQERVESPGEFAIHGGVVDLFPPGDELPLRLDYFGDELESLHRFDPASQRREAAEEQTDAPLETARLTPLGEFINLPQLRTALADFLRGGENLRARQRLEPLATQGTYPGMAGEARALPDYFTPAPALFSAHARLIVLEAPAVSHALERAHAGLNESFQQTGFAPFQPAQFLQPELAEKTLGAAAGYFGLTPCGEGPVHEFQSRRSIQFNGDLKRLETELRAVTQSCKALLLTQSAGMGERLQSVLHERQLYPQPLLGPLDQAPVLSLALSPLAQGFVYPAAGLALFTEAEIFGEGRRSGKTPRPAAAAFLSDLRDLKPGDLVVHVDHGVGRYAGLRTLNEGGLTQEFIILEFAGDGKLYVPVGRLDLIQKYVGGAGAPLDRIGGKVFEKTKARARTAAKEIAGELLRLYAARRRAPGYPFMPDTEWQAEFESLFPFEETADQAKAIADVKRDMESENPMDRLVLGDVGYGKTEVAMRAAFKAAAEGKQVALLAPTTILAYQHFENFTERFRPFPFKVALLSRFVDKAQQAQTLVELAAGKLNVVIATHRLLSKDVQFHDLGLLIVDEEQRFGVSHKEKLKKLKHGIDCLTLSATPIPRTLQMSLSGLRDLSLIETPPVNRLAIETLLTPFRREAIISAIRRETERGGQVFFVHNRIDTLPSISAMLVNWIPGLRVAFAHGQMDEVQLENLLHQFTRGELDVLCTTTIIENGIDMPNVNTLIVNRADRFGLSQLYQIRGRIGRSDRQAWALLMLPADGRVTPEASMRLEALREFSDLGAGFRIAALDLELRGAGALLGASQSGHIEAIGFEMYMRMLDDAVRELSGEPVQAAFRTEVQLGLDLTIPESFLGELNERLILYRRLALAESVAAVERLGAEFRDRYGELPEKVGRLLAATTVRLRAEKLRCESLRLHDGKLAWKFLPASPLDLQKLGRLIKSRPGAHFAANGVLTVPAPAGAGEIIALCGELLGELGA